MRDDGHNYCVLHHPNEEGCSATTSWRFYETLEEARNRFEEIKDIIPRIPGWYIQLYKCCDDENPMAVYIEDLSGPAEVFEDDEVESEEATRKPAMVTAPQKRAVAVEGQMELFT